MREGQRVGVAVPGQEVPGPLVVHLLPLFPLLPAPLALFVPARERKKTQNLLKQTHPNGARKANAAVSHGLHVGSGELKGPFHRQRVERRHPLALDLQVQPGTRETEGKGPLAKKQGERERVCVFVSEP